MVEASSLGVMAQRLCPSDSKVTVKVVEWEQEASVSEFAIPRDAPYPRLPSANGKVTILTGATGFLGRQILQQLVFSSNIAEVHCIAVRSSSSTRDLHIKSDKIFVHYRDLSLSRLGLTEETFASLLMRGDVIIHNGADVSFLKSYSSLKKSNVGSTSELIRLSAPRQIPIHFISSAGVAEFVPPELLPLKNISVTVYPLTKGGVHGYQAAKWVSERLLEAASEKHGMKVDIHRPTGIIRDHASNTDIIANFLQYSRAISAAPDMYN